MGAPLELYNNPRNRFVAGFLGSPKMNFLESTVERVEGSAVTVNVGGTQFAAPARRRRKAGDKITLGIRPEHMARRGAGTRFADLRVDLWNNRDLTMLYASTKGASRSLWRSRASSTSRWQHGDGYVDPTRYHAFAADGLAL